MTETSSIPSTLVNVIEHDIPPGRDFAERFGEIGLNRRQEDAAMDALSARRRREFDAARSHLHGQTIRENVEGVRQARTRPLADTQAEKDDTARVLLDQPPEQVRKRYLRAGNQYFLKDSPYQLAFEDLGRRLTTEHNRPDVVESMVAMAAEKSWRRIRVSGHEMFRSEAWLQGTLLGIEVSGYEPKVADLARLSEARQSRQSNRIDVVASTPRGSSQTPVEETSTPTTVSAPRVGVPLEAAGTSDVLPAGNRESPRPRQVVRPPTTGEESDASKRYAGELREHSLAPYQNNPARSDSYYVVLRDAMGVDQVVWGVDLERAMLESRAEPGQQIMMESLGRRIVTVNVPILDDLGAVVGEEERGVHRNTWRVEVVDRELSAVESVTRTARAFNGSPDPVDKPTHEDREEHRSRMISDEDKVLHLAVLGGAMREQGFSARSISRVQRRAEQMLDAFGKEGIAVPRPKVFDPNAPSERDRRARSAKDRGSVREIERVPAEPSLER